LAHTKSLQDLW